MTFPSSGGQVRGQVHEYFHTYAPPKSYEHHLIGPAHPFPLKREPDSKRHARVPRAGCSATSLIGLQPRAAPSSTNNPNPAIPSPVPENQSINQSSRALQLNQASLIHSRQSIAHTHAHTRTHGYSIFATGGSGRRPNSTPRTLPHPVSVPNQERSRKQRGVLNPAREDAVARSHEVGDIFVLPAIGYADR